MSFDLTLLLSALAQQTATKSILSTTEDPTSTNPVELGVVHWQRDHAAAFAKAADAKRPVLLLFQEIPG